MKIMVLIIVFSPSVIETMEGRRTYYHLWAEDSKIGKLRTQDSATAWHTLTHIRRSCASAKHNENDVSLIRFRRGACGSWVVRWLGGAIFVYRCHCHCCCASARMLWEKFRRLKMFRWETWAPHAFSKLNQNVLFACTSNVSHLFFGGNKCHWSSLYASW